MTKYLAVKEILSMLIHVLAVVALVMVIVWGFRAEDAYHKFTQHENVQIDPAPVQPVPTSPDGSY